MVSWRTGESAITPESEMGMMGIGDAWQLEQVVEEAGQLNEGW